MRIPLLIAFTLAAGVAAHGAHARDHNGRFAVLSVGADTCREYIAARETGGTAPQRYNQWLLGYLSAFNAIVADTYDILGDSNGRRITDRLGDYCRHNPDETFVNASAALTLTLYPERRVSAPARRDGLGQWTDAGHVDAPD